MEVQMRIICIFIVMNPSATEEVKKNLTGTEGGSITLPDPVVVTGFALFGRTIIAMVNERTSQIYEDRVLWNNNTGLFTITGLQRNDSGIYHIDSKKGRVFLKSYKLTVYESVPTPAVNTLNVGAESCTLLCFVEKAEETTLLWYKNEEILNQSSSALSLPLTVHKQDFSSSYRCVAANPAENKTHPVNVTTSCGGQDNTEGRSERHYLIAIPIMSAVIVAFFIKWKYLDKNKRTARQAQDSVNREPDVPYTIMTYIYLRTDAVRKDIYQIHKLLTAPNLTTAYYKLEAHHMVPIHTDTADHVYIYFPHT